MKEEMLIDFYNHLKKNQLPDSVNQESKGKGENKYTADMWTIEVCECLIGIDCKQYKYYEQKLLMYETLESVKDNANVLCVGEVGRGLDI